MRNKISALVLSAVLLMPAAGLAQKAASVTITPAEKAAAANITAENIKHYLYFIASDAMGGRDTPSQGLDITAEFLKMNLARWGFKPAGDNGTFFQKIALRRETVDTAKTYVKVGDSTYKLGDDFFRLQGNSEVSGGFVFGGDGWFVRSKNIDAFSGVDVKGKIVVIASKGFAQRTLTQRPAGVTDEDLKGEKGVDWADPIEHATRKGAAAVLVVAPEQFQKNWNQIRGFFSRGSMFPEKLRPATTGPSTMPVMMISSAMADSIFANESGNAASERAFNINKSGSVGSVSTVKTEWTQNVVALWEGSDPKLKHEMVAIGAHYDHVGTNENAPGPDKIWNGADDDGSGTVAVLAIAEALAKAKVKPQRSILFVWHTGEEKGLWGSDYFNRFPTVDIKNVIAQLNIDMIGRSKAAGDTNPKNAELSGPKEIYLIGSEMMSSTLGAVTKQTNDKYLKLAYNTKYDDPKDPNRFFFRSDHFHYAQNGIPVVFWFDGVHEDYHQPGDSADKIDYQKMEDVTRTIFLTLWELSGLKERPVIDKELPEELKQR